MPSRPCIPPPPPSADEAVYYCGLRTRMGAIEQSASDTVRPPSRREGAVLFRVFNIAPHYELLVIDGDSYGHAAVRAAQRLYGKSAAQRETGAAGGPGMFIAFNVGDEETVAFRLEICK